MIRRMAAVLAALAVAVAFSASAAYADGTNFPYDGQNPNTENGCDNNVIDSPGTVRPIYMHNQQYGELLIREAAAGSPCYPGKWAEVRFGRSLGYTVAVWMTRESDGVGDEFTTQDTISPVFTAVFSLAGTCATYGAAVADPVSGDKATLDGRICDSSSSGSGTSQSSGSQSTTTSTTTTTTTQTTATTAPAASTPATATAPAQPASQPAHSVSKCRKGWYRSHGRCRKVKHKKPKRHSCKSQRHHCKPKSQQHPTGRLHGSS